MATPVAHCIAGLSIYYLARTGSVPSRYTRPASILLLVLVAANLPDLDFLPGLLTGSPEKFHREFSHSLTFSVLSSLVLLIYLKLVRVQSAIFISTLWLVAVSSHLFIDWLSLDVSDPSGIELWWPLSEERFISDHILFPGARRDQVFSEFTIGYNLFAISWELMIMMPGLALCRFLSGKYQPDLPE